MYVIIKKLWVLIIVIYLIGLELMCFKSKNERMEQEDQISCRNPAQHNY